MSGVSLSDLDIPDKSLLDLLPSGSSSEVSSIREAADEPEPGECLRFSETVEQAIASISADDDPFSKADFNVVDYINQQFPTEQSLCNIDEFTNKIKSDIQEIDAEIAEIVQGQSAASLDGQKAVVEAKSAIQELFGRIREIKTKTDMSESMVKEITRDIKQLDVAKKNLTASITTLNHLHMLISGVDLLQEHIKKKKYADVANLLPGIVTVSEHFDKYLNIEQIKKLSDQVHQLRHQLTSQIVSDFKDYFSNPFSYHAAASKPTSQQQGRPEQSQMTDVCRVVAVLDKSIQNELIAWVLQQQMAEYLVLFDDTQDNAWLDRLDERYKWFCGKLSEFEEKYQNVFPVQWTMPLRFATDFCRLTRSMLEKVILKRRTEIDVKLLIFAIQRTNNFEALLRKRFPNAAPSGDKLEKSDDLIKKNNFQGSIGRVFENYMDVYVNAQDRTLNSLLETFCSKLRDGSALPTRQQQSYEPSAVTLQSSGDLFMVYKKCIQQTAQITDDWKILVDLAQVFKKYLREYANKVLLGAMPKLGAHGAQPTTTAGLIQSLLKEGETTKLTKDETYLICCLLTTAEFCAETTVQLQDKLKEKIYDNALHPKLDMSIERESFHGVVANCIQALVRDLEACCEPSLQAMTKMQWSTIDQVGDESRYVSNIRSHVRANVPILRDHLSNARKYFAQFCLKFASAFVAKFLACIFRCKPISEDGAEQLLLDAHSLKTELLNLPNVSSAVSRDPPLAYTNIVLKGMNKAEMILKLVMTKIQEPDHFVDHYVKMMPDSDLGELQKVLEMKNVRGAGQTSFLDAYRQKCGSKAAQLAPSSLQSDSSIFPSASVNAYFTSVMGGTVIDAESKIRKLEKLVRKRVL